jgi:hypothetical protein
MKESPEGEAEPLENRRKTMQRAVEKTNQQDSGRHVESHSERISSQCRLHFRSLHEITEIGRAEQRRDTILVCIGLVHIMGDVYYITKTPNPQQIPTEPSPRLFRNPFPFHYGSRYLGRQVGHMIGRPFSPQGRSPRKYSWPLESF